MLLDYLPKFMQSISEIKKIMIVCEPEINQINENIDLILRDLFVYGSTQTGTEHYEKMLKITPKKNDSLKKRQYDILALYNQTLPFTLETLKYKLNAICGENGYTLEMIYEEFLLKVRVLLEKKETIYTVENLLEAIVPVNIQLDSSLDFNLWKHLTPYTWKSLSRIDWKYIKEDEIIAKDRNPVNKY